MVKIELLDSSDQQQDQDLISALPDSLLVEIISRLPTTKEAIRTSTLSKRWQHTWTSVSNLAFYHFEDRGLSLAPFYESVYDTFAKCHQSNLDKLKLIITKVDHRIQRVINSWIRLAIDRNVKELDLTLVRGGYSKLDESFFTVSCFTDLNLNGFVFQPYGAIYWSNLKNLCITDGSLDEELIEKMMLGTPCLQRLRFERCYGFDRINITGPSVRTFQFCGYNDGATHDESRIIEINGPHLLSLEIEHTLVLWKLVLLDVSSLIEAKLDYCKFGYYETTSNEANEEMLKHLILSLRHVKELHVGTYCCKPLLRLKAKGFGFPTNVKIAWEPSETEYDSDDDEDEENPNAPQKWRDYTVEFHFPEPTELTPPLLQLNDVSFSYPERDEFRLLHVDVGIDMGTRVAIVGPSGAGKSTLLNLLAGDLKPTGGEVRRSQKLRIGRYSQHFVDLLTMGETPVQYLLRLHPDQEGLSKQEAVRAKLGKFGIPSHNHVTPIADLSGGQKARVVFTSISMSKPHILLLDEPTNHLDMQSIDALANALDEFSGGVVLVSHDSRLISRVCEDEERTQIWEVDNGLVEEFEGTFEDYKNKLLKEIRAEVDD